MSSTEGSSMNSDDWPDLAKFGSSNARGNSLCAPVVNEWSSEGGICQSIPLAEMGFRVISTDGIAARHGVLKLAHGPVETPVFMPVGTYGSLKGFTPEQLLTDEMDCQILLANTYHLGHRPGDGLIRRAGGLHKFMHWPRSILTDSGGFQMVSLSKLMQITEQGVQFESPHTNEMVMLTPERCVEIQESLGSDIAMQLDHVVPSLTSGPIVEEAMQRSIRWLDRCIAAHSRPHDQTIFPIVQGGLDINLRERCVTEMVKRARIGIAIGGLSGGEAKHSFWRVVARCCELIPKHLPRYVMGVGWPIDLVVASALGADMFDCVFPTRTARFGTALVRGRRRKAQQFLSSKGHQSSSTNDCHKSTDEVSHSSKIDPANQRLQKPSPLFESTAVAGVPADPPETELHLRQSRFKDDLNPIDLDCQCQTCRRGYSRAFLHANIGHDPIACRLISVHNVNHHLDLMRRLRRAIDCGQLIEFIRQFLYEQFGTPDAVPEWVCDALIYAGCSPSLTWTND